MKGISIKTLYHAIKTVNMFSYNNTLRIEYNYKTDAFVRYQRVYKKGKYNKIEGDKIILYIDDADSIDGLMDVLCSEISTFTKRLNK